MGYMRDLCDSVWFRAGDSATDINWYTKRASLAALYRISEAMVDPEVQLADLLVTILDVALEVVSADRGCVLMASEETDGPQPRVYRERTTTESEQGELVSYGSGELGGGADAI